MLKKMLIYFTMVVFPVAAASASGTPVLLLHEGENIIPVVISNNYFTDLENITISISPEAIPSWLTVQEPSEAIDIGKGAQTEDTLTLFITVDNPPSEAATVLPLRITDATGNHWNFDISVSAESTRPVETALYNNFPNPFNPSTTIGYSLSEPGIAKLVIYNSLGQVVRTLVNGHQASGAHSVQWDGRNDSGRKVSSGFYLCTMISGRFKQTKRMMMVE